MLMISIGLHLCALLFYLHNGSAVKGDVSTLEGHMKPLGSSTPHFSVPIVRGFPTPRDFFNHYVIPSIPVLFKNGAKLSPGFTKWSDDYLINHPESENEIIFAEHGKKENRSMPGDEMTFREFLEQYNTTDMYMVQELPRFMGSDFLLPRSLQCQPVRETLSATVVWFSSGGTKSVLHSDDYDNINCLFRGKKTLVLINPHESEDISRRVIDDKQTGHSSVDVDKVDFTKFPDLARIRYARVDMEAGDCMYIPFIWYHQVNSFGSNLAVNIWWTHCTKEFIDLTDEVCGIFSEADTLSGYKLQPKDVSDSPTEQSSLHKVYERLYEKKTAMTKNEARELVKQAEHAMKSWDGRCERLLQHYLKLLDQNGDEMVDAVDAQLFYKSDEKAKLTLEEQMDALHSEFLIAMERANFNDERKLVQKLLERGEIDEKRFAEIYPNDRLLADIPRDEF